MHPLPGRAEYIHRAAHACRRTMVAAPLPVKHEHLVIVLDLLRGEARGKLGFERGVGWTDT